MLLAATIGTNMARFGSRLTGIGSEYGPPSWTCADTMRPLGGATGLASLGCCEEKRRDGIVKHSKSLSSTELTAQRECDTSNDVGPMST